MTPVIGNHAPTRPVVITMGRGRRGKESAPVPAVTQPTSAGGDPHGERVASPAGPADAGNRLAEIQVPPERGLTRDCLQNPHSFPNLPRIQAQNGRDLHFCNWRRFLYTGMTSIPARTVFPEGRFSLGMRGGSAVRRRSRVSSLHRCNRPSRRSLSGRRDRGSRHPRVAHRHLWRVIR